MERRFSIGRTLLTEPADRNSYELEPYVAPEQAAEFLKVNRLKVIRMARAGTLPAHPLGLGHRRQWRFKLSELDKYMQGRVNIHHPLVRQ